MNLLTNGTPVNRDGTQYLFKLVLKGDSLQLIEEENDEKSLAKDQNMSDELADENYLVFSISVLTVRRPGKNIFL